MSLPICNAIALIIGIEDYENTTANVKYARNDANVFYDFARKKLGVSNDRIKVITDEEADLKGVWLSVKNWLNRLSVKDKTDVFIFYAGHGLSTDNGKDMFIMPYDGEMTLLNKTAISRSDIFNEVSAAGPKSVTVFLILVIRD